MVRLGWMRSACWSSMPKLEAFSVSNVTILFLLSLGIGLMPKLGGAIGLDDHVGVWCALGLELCMLD